MRLPNFLAALASAGCLWMVVGSCIAEEPGTLIEAVTHFAKQRQAIRSYELTIRADVDDAATPVKLSNGTTHVPAKKLAAFTMEMAADYETGQWLVARGDLIETIATGKKVNDRWQIWLTSPKTKPDDVFGPGRTLSRGASGTKPRFFDPLALGVGLAGEYSMGTPLEKIAHNYQQWNDQRPVEVEDGIVSYGQPDDVYLKFDRDKAMTPVEIRKAAKNNLTGLWLKIEPVEKHGVWLPAKAEVQIGDQRQRLVFQWESINEDVSHRFVTDGIATRYGVNLR